MAHSLRNQLASLGTSFGVLTHYRKSGNSKLVPRSLCDAPIDMRLCGPGLRKPSDRPVLTAALCCLMFYLFEAMAMTRGFSAPQSRNLMFLPRWSVKQRQLCCVSYRT